MRMDEKKAYFKSHELNLPRMFSSRWFVHRFPSIVPLKHKRVKAVCKSTQHRIRTSTLQPSHTRNNIKPSSMSEVIEQAHPVPKGELPILKRLQDYRKKLAKAKKNHEIKTMEDLNVYTDSVAQTMDDLRMVRAKEDSEDVFPRNRVDKVVDDIWLILFHVWSSIANVSESLYGVYSELCGVLDSLEMLKGRSIYDNDLIRPLQERAQALENQFSENGRWLDPNISREQQKGDMIPNGQAALSTIVNRIYHLAHEMLSVYEHISPDLLPTMKRLEYLSDKVSKLESSEDHLEPASIASIQRELDAVEASKVRGNFWGPEGAKHDVDPPAGQAVMQMLVEKLYDRLRILLLSKEKMDDSLFPIYEALLSIRRQAGILMKETDRKDTFRMTEVVNVASHMEDLQKNHFHDGVWKSSSTLPAQPVDVKTQALLNLLAAQIYHCLFTLALRLECIDESLMALTQDLGAIWVKLRDLSSYRSDVIFRPQSQSSARSISDTHPTPMVTVDDVKKLDMDLGKINACRDERGCFWPHTMSGVEIREALLDGEATPSGQVPLKYLHQECKFRLYALSYRLHL
ncbi:hypothetical protein SeLEV6574_g01973 [Synchytrium endobioticum]|uniref:Uncharacterized protein n=1 Tax=Synchytrium endobioticum TaxID=286115 RepID=A0A507DB08_9FUNG|nr:hypothetical protein SeLEV6574_g01973 [Synchytrium endobioticum]